MTISVFGNEDLAVDSLPLKILPKLREAFPIIEFKVEDPNELDVPDIDEWRIIDTVSGIKKVQVLTVADLKNLNQRLSLHDFDLGSHLFWVSKLNKKTDIKIIGIPDTITESKAFEKTADTIANLLLENERHS